MKKYLIFSLIISGIFFFNSANAETIEYQTYYSQSTSSFTRLGPSYAQQFHPETGKIFNQIKFQTEYTTTTSCIEGHIMVASTTYPIAGSQITHDQLIASTTLPIGTTEVIFNLDQNYVASSTEWYIFAPFPCTGGSQYPLPKFLYEPTSTPYRSNLTEDTDGNICNYYSGQCFQWNNSNFAFSVTNNGTASSTANQITIVYPDNSTSTSVFFKNWIVDVRYETITYATSSPFYTGVIYTADNAEDLNYNTISELNTYARKNGVITIDCDYASCVGNTSIVPIPNLMILKPGQTYSARAVLLYDGAIVALSPIITYGTNNATIAETIYNPLYGYSATSTDIDDTCTWSTNPRNWVTCITIGITDVVQFLVVPHDLSLTPINNAINGFKDIFPFKFFFQFNDIVQNQITSFDTNGNAKLYFPVVFPNGASSSIVIMSSSSLSNVIGSPAKTLWFDLQKWLAWIAVSWLSLKLILHKKK